MQMHILGTTDKHNTKYMVTSKVEIRTTDIKKTNGGKNSTLQRPWISQFRFVLRNQISNQTEKKHHSKTQAYIIK